MRIRRFRRGKELVESASNAQPQATKEPPPYGLKALFEPHDAEVDIIFIHGLMGHRENTWKAEDANQPWPKVLLPEKLHRARALTYGYDARCDSLSSVVSSNTVGQHGRNMLSTVATYRAGDNTENRPIIWVAHSLGGIVCADALVASRNSAKAHLRKIIDCTRAIAFLGTPHAGSNFAKFIAQVVCVVSRKATNKAILQVLSPASEVLGRIQEDFHTMLKAREKEGHESIEITCFYEELVNPYVNEIVSPKSASLLGYTNIGIHANHETMSKFNSINDPGFISVVGELQRWVKEFDILPGFKSDFPPNVCSSLDKNEVHALPVTGKLSTIPYGRNLDFVGREDILHEIETEVKKKGGRQIALYGMGGVGKSQILLEYAHRTFEGRSSTSVFWVSALNPQRFRETYRKIAESLNLANSHLLTGQTSCGTETMKLVKKTLEKTTGKWLMLVDNADDTDMLSERAVESGESLFDYIPENSHGAIIYSTQNKASGNWLTGQKKLMHIEPLDHFDSTKLLIKKLQDAGMDSKPGEGWTFLLEELEYLPLGISQVASYMIQNEWSISTCYQHFCKDMSFDILRHEFREKAREERAIHGDQVEHSMTSAVLRTFTLTFLEVRKQNVRATDMLCQMAFYEQNFERRSYKIPIDLLRDPDIAESPGSFDASFGLLTGYSLTSAIYQEERGSATMDEREFQVPRLVQRCTRHWLESQGQFDYWAHRALRCVSRYFPDGYYLNVRDAFKMKHHLPTVLSHISLPGNDIAMYHELLIRYSVYLNNDGGPELLENLALENWARKAVSIAKQYLADHELSLAKSFLLLAKALSYKHMYEEAEIACRQALENCVRTSTTKTVVALEIMDLLVYMLQAQGNHDEAKIINSKISAIPDIAFEFEQPEELKLVFEITRMMSRQGRYHEAERLLVVLLEAQKSVHGLTDPATLATMRELAGVFHLQGHSVAARSINDQLFTIEARLRGPKHPESIRLQSWLLFREGRHDEAEMLLRNVLEPLRYEQKPMAILSLAYDLAQLLIARQKYEDAEACIDEIYNMLELKYGSYHPEVITYLNTLHAALLGQRKIERRWVWNEEDSVDKLEWVELLPGINPYSCLPCYRMTRLEKTLGSFPIRRCSDVRWPYGYPVEAS